MRWCGVAGRTSSCFEFVVALWPCRACSSLPLTPDAHTQTCVLMCSASCVCRCACSWPCLRAGVCAACKSSSSSFSSHSLLLYHAQARCPSHPGWGIRAGTVPCRALHRVTLQEEQVGPSSAHAVAMSPSDISVVCVRSNRPLHLLHHLLTDSLYLVMHLLAAHPGVHLGPSLSACACTYAAAFKVTMHVMHHASHMCTAQHCTSTFTP